MGWSWAQWLCGPWGGFSRSPFGECERGSSSGREVGMEECEEVLLAELSWVRKGEEQGERGRSSLI